MYAALSMAGASWIPVTATSGYREYSRTDMGRNLPAAEGLRKLGMSLAEIGPLLDDPDSILDV